MSTMQVSTMNRVLEYIYPVRRFYSLTHTQLYTANDDEVSLKEDDIIFNIKQVKISTVT